MALPSLLRTVRLLQSGHCLSLVRIPSHQRNYNWRCGLLSLHEMKPWSPASLPIRFLNQETLSAEEETNALSVDIASSISDQKHVLGDEYSLQKDVDHSPDGEKTSLLSTRTRAPKTLSCIEVLDAFTSDSSSPHQPYCSILDLWRILTINNKWKPSDTQLIFEHPNFLNFCCEVRKSIASMSNKLLVCSLYVFVSLKVNQKAMLIQTLLSVCQQRLNTFNLEEIYILGISLKMTKSNKNANVLKFGLSLLIDLKCESIKDVATLQNLMVLAPVHLARKYEMKALQMTDRFTVSQCYNMFSVLAEINLRSVRLLDSCSQKIIDCSEEFSCKRVMFLTNHCSKLSYFNEKLLSVIGDNIMDNIYMWDIKRISQVLKGMAYLRFRHVPLLDYFADKLMEESESLDMYYLLVAAKTYSILNHLPEGKSEEFLKTLCTGLDLHMNSMQNKHLINCVYSLCVLGMVYHPAVNKLLEDKSLLNTLDNTEKIYLDQIKLCLSMELGSCPFSTQDLEKMVETRHSDTVVKCHNLLKNYFKDPALYQENMQLRNGYVIDFVLTLDKEQSKLVPTGVIQDFESTQNMTRLAVLCYSPGAFTLGSLHPVGNLTLKMRLLKSFGFSVVVVPVDNFMMLTEAKKVEFLKENICKDISSIQHSVQTNDMEQIAPHDTQML